MFTQLAPLIRERTVMLTILASPAAGEEIRLVITPQRIRDDDPPPKLENLAVAGTPEELDLELPEALAGWVRNRKTLVDQFDEAKKAAAANAQAAIQAQATLRAQAAKKTTAAPTKSSTPAKTTGKAAGTPQEGGATNAVSPDTVDDLMDAFGKKEGEAPAQTDADTTMPATSIAPASDAASGRLDLEDMSNSAAAATSVVAPADDEGGWE